MENITIWHNPRCSKSRDSFNFLVDKKISTTVVKYLDETPSKDELKKVLTLLGMKSARELMRVKEIVYKELNLKEEIDEEKLLDAMIANPQLIERPIIIRGDRAVLGRPIEKVVELLS